MRPSIVNNRDQNDEEEDIRFVLLAIIRPSRAKESSPTEPNRRKISLPCTCDRGNGNAPLESETS